MNALIAEMKRREIAERVEAHNLYRAICARADSPRDGDAETLHRVCGLLGISADTFEQDVAALRKVAELSEVVSREAEVRVQLKQISLARKARQEALKAHVCEEEGHIRQAGREQVRLQHSLDRIQAARDEIPVVKQEAWRPFASPKPAMPVGRNGPDPRILQAWLADSAPLMMFPTNGHPSVIRAMREAGYTPQGEGVWALKMAAEPAKRPTKTATTKKTTRKPAAAGAS